MITGSWGYLALVFVVCPPQRQSQDAPSPSLLLSWWSIFKTNVPSCIRFLTRKTGIVYKRAHALFVWRDSLEMLR